MPGKCQGTKLAIPRNPVLIEVVLTEIFHNTLFIDAFIAIFECT